jgi:hypothetical protein
MGSRTRAIPPETGLEPSGDGAGAQRLDRVLEAPGTRAGRGRSQRTVIAPEAERRGTRVALNASTGSRDHAA